MARDKDKQRVRQRLSAQKNAEYIRSIKESHSCETCGESRAVCLDFHHRVPSQKVFSVGMHSKRSFAKIDAEIAKCMVICSNCHRVLHAQLRLERVRRAPVEDFPLFDDLGEDSDVSVQA